MEERGMRLAHLTGLLRERGYDYKYTEEDGLGSVDFSYRGVAYHVWEFMDDDGTRGVETNIRHGGHVEEITGDYENIVISEIRSW